MSGTVTDLDVLAAPPREVKLAGKTYLLPGDVPIPTMLRLERYSERMAEVADQVGDDEAKGREANREAILRLYDEVLKLFQVYQPDLEELPIQMSQLVRTVNAIYGSAAQEAEEEDPTGPPGGKTRKKTGKQKSPASSS